MTKCSCKRVAPRCEYCRADKRKRNKAAYTTEKRRERARRERMRIKLVGHKPDYLDVGYAEKILARRPPSSPITWLELSAGRSNS